MTIELIKPIHIFETVSEFKGGSRTLSILAKTTQRPSLNQVSEIVEDYYRRKNMEFQQVTSIALVNNHDNDCVALQDHAFEGTKVMFVAKVIPEQKSHAEKMAGASDYITAWLSIVSPQEFLFYDDEQIEFFREWIEGNGYRMCGIKGVSVNGPALVVA